MNDNPGEEPQKAAFEVSKGEQGIRILSEDDVVRSLDRRELLNALKVGFLDLERGRVQAPGRPEITVPDRGFSLAMPAWRAGDPIAVKVVNVFDRNLAVGIPNHLALISLFDAETGAALCVMDGTYITGVRTAASAVVSVDLLSKRNARTVTVVGAGVQALEHLRLLPLVRDFDRITVCSLHPDEAERLAAQSPIGHAQADLRTAVEESDVVCLATHSAFPVIDAEWVQPGTHVSSVGYHPPNGELPRRLATAGRLFVESHDAFQPVPVGCADLDHLDGEHATTLGEVIVDAARGRTDDQQITVYKAMGLAMEDLVAAALTYRTALETNRGTTVPW